MYSQFDYGVNGGMSMSSKDAFKADNSENNLKGFYAGFYGEVNFLVLYVRPEINFIRHSSKINSKDYSSNIKNIKTYNKANVGLIIFYFKFFF